MLRSGPTITAISSARCAPSPCASGCAPVASQMSFARLRLAARAFGACTIALAGGLLALGLFAYRPLLLGALELPSLGSVEGWFFAPEEKTPLFAVAAAGWMLWRRRARLAALPDARDAVGAAALLVVGAGLFAWAELTRTADLLLPSLSANLLAFACAAKGRAGARVALLPALVVLLGVAIPGPIRSEIVWQLQLWSAQAAAFVLERGGREVELSGVQLLHGPFSFTVIDSCSGLRGIEILTLVAFVIRELFAGAGRREWLLVALAPPLGFALNLARIVLVVLSTSGVDPAQAVPGAWDHTVEGVSALVAGTVLLYLCGHWLAGSRHARGGAAPERRASGTVAPTRVWTAAVAALAALAALSFGLPPFPASSEGVHWVELPLSHAGWDGEDLALDRTFLGPVYAAQALHRRYQKAPSGGPPQSVELFVG